MACGRGITFRTLHRLYRRCSRIIGLKAGGVSAESVNEAMTLLVGSGWHSAIFRAEAAALFGKVRTRHRRFVEISNFEAKQCQRSATIDEALRPSANADWSEVTSPVSTISSWCEQNLDEPSEGQTIAVRASTLDASPREWQQRALEREIGAALVKLGWSVNLDSPDVTFRIIVAGPENGPTNPDTLAATYSGHSIAWGVRIFSSENDWKSRAAPLRPFFKPVSLDARLARAMVNLAHPNPVPLKQGQFARGETGRVTVSKQDFADESVLNDVIRYGQNVVVEGQQNQSDECESNRISLVDPFCGTGGFLLEAALLGIPTLGTDLDSRMVDGSKENLIWLRQNFDAENCVTLRTDNALSLELSAAASGFVFDPPYGRNSWRSDESLALFIGALARCRENATPDSRLVTLLPWPPEQIEAMRRGELLSDSSQLCLGITWPKLKAKIRATGWLVLERVPISIHGSLSRLLVILSKDHPGL